MKVVSAVALLITIAPVAALRAQSPLESLASPFALNACVSQQFEPAERIERCSEELNAAESLEAIGISLVGRGWAQFELGRMHAAVADFQRATEQGSDGIRSDALLGLGYAFAEIGDLERAIAYLEQVTLLAPYPFHAYTALGSLRASMGHYDLALSNFDQALAISPRFIPALVARGETHLRFEEYEAALRDLDLTLQVSPRDLRALAARGNVHCFLGDVEQSAEDTFQVYVFSGHEIRTQMQSALADGGYYDGPIDGESDELVFSALRFGAEDQCAV